MSHWPEDDAEWARQERARETRKAGGSGSGTSSASGCWLVLLGWVGAVAAVVAGAKGWA